MLSGIVAVLPFRLRLVAWPPPSLSGEDTYRPLFLSYASLAETDAEATQWQEKTEAEAPPLQKETEAEATPLQEETEAEATLLQEETEAEATPLAEKQTADCEDGVEGPRRVGRGSRVHHAGVPRRGRSHA